MKPDAAAPQRGSFVRDQAAGLREAGIDVELLEMPPGWRRYAGTARQIRRVLRDGRFDLVHAHLSLTGWAAKLAGARPLVVTFHGTDVRHPVGNRLARILARRVDLAGVASRDLLTPALGRPGLRRRPGFTAILPCGADLERFRPLDQATARAELGLENDGRYLLFPAATGRPEKRFDRASEVARLAGAKLLTAGRIDPKRMPLWVNAASAVLVTSEYEGFGLAAVEALGCGRPVLSTPVGIAPALLGGIEGCIAEPFDAERWARLARAHLDAGDARVAGETRAAWFSAPSLAERVAQAYADLARVGSDDLS